MTDKHTFDTALTGMRHGVKYNRLANSSNGSYYLVEDNELYLFFPAHLENTYNKMKIDSLASECFLADDWVVVG